MNEKRRPLYRHDLDVAAAILALQDEIVKKPIKCDRICHRTVVLFNWRMKNLIFVR